jgi:predicted nucleic acid-binding protein
LSVVIDASVVVAAIVGGGETGRWAERILARGDLVAPHLMTAEATNALRRAELACEISRDAAALAVRDLVDLPVDFYPFEPFAARVWDLRRTITAYDAWYVAVAESLDATLVTLDARLSRAPGPVCRFEVPAY